MRKAKIISDIDQKLIEPVQLDDFSRFKEKMIMINTLKNLLDKTDKSLYKDIVREEGGKMTHKSLKRALEEIVRQAIRQVSK